MSKYTFKKVGKLFSRKKVSKNFSFFSYKQVSIVLFLLVVITALVLLIGIQSKPNYIVSASTTMLHVNGNHFVDASGNQVVLRGAARWSLEFSCGDGQFSLQDFQAMKTWGINIVRIPLNENFWLFPTLCNNQYVSTVQGAVTNAEAAGMYVLLDLHRINPYDNTSANQIYPLTESKSVSFWQQLAGIYKNDPSVLFEPKNEPHQIDCNTWQNGGTVTSGGSGGWSGEIAGTYQGVGMQTIVNTIRSVAPNNVIIVDTGGEADAACAVTNPLQGTNIAYQSHFYHTDPNVWAGQFSGLTSKVPVIAGEFDITQGIKVPQVFEGLKTGYIGWAWHGSCGMVSDFNGTPCAGWQPIRDFMLNASQTNTTVTSQLTTTSIGTIFSVTLCPHGLGNCGDNVNANSGGNTNPLHSSRNITVTILNAQNQPVSTGQGSVTYSSSSQNFQGTISVPNLSPGSYITSIKMDGFLSKPIPGIITLGSQNSVNLPQVSLVTGDINNDGQLDILDYNLIISCFGSKQTTSSCTYPPTTQAPGADINDDGKVDGIDYNLFLRELSVQRGSGGPTPSVVPTFTPAPTVNPTQAPTGGPYQLGIPAAPPMGADPWLTYHDNLSILNENYFMKMADFMHTQKFPVWDGTQKTMQEAGYTYVTIDDAWQGTRQGSNPLPPNPNFTNIGNSNPSIGLIAHVHSLGMKMGLYSDMGTAVCVPQTNGPQSGSYGYEMIDGAEFQQWGADYLKLDYCNVPTSNISCPGMSDPYECDLSIWRKAVGSNILLYMNTAGGHAPWTWAAKDNSVNTWRVNQPAHDGWSGQTGSVMDTLDGSGSYLQQSNAVPYHWSDANYMAVGMSLTLDESKSQFSMWSIVTSQLIASNDILLMKPGDIASQVFFNTEVIAIDQDSNVVQGKKILTVNGVEVWTKPLAGNKFAVAFLNTNAAPVSISVQFSQIGLPPTVSFRDLWAHQNLGSFTNSFTTINIPSHGIQLVRSI